MKKKIISIMANPIFIFLLLMTFLYPLMIVHFINTDGSKFFLYLKGVGYTLLVELVIVLFVSLITGSMFLIVTIYDKLTEKKEARILIKQKDALIQMFSLEANEFTEVNGLLPNCVENKKVLLDIINDSNGKNTELSVNVSSKVHSLPLDNVIDELSIDFFTDILKTIGFKFYLSMKDNEDKEIFLSIKNENISYNLLIDSSLYSLFLENWTIV